MKIWVFVIYENVSFNFYIDLFIYLFYAVYSCFSIRTEIVQFIYEIKYTVLCQLDCYLKYIYENIYAYKDGDKDGLNANEFNWWVMWLSSRMYAFPFLPSRSLSFLFLSFPSLFLLFGLQVNLNDILRESAQLASETIDSNRIYSGFGCVYPHGGRLSTLREVPLPRHDKWSAMSVNDLQNWRLRPRPFDNQWGNHTPCQSPAKKPGQNHVRVATMTAFSATTAGLPATRSLQQWTQHPQIHRAADSRGPRANSRRPIHKF